MSKVSLENLTKVDGYLGSCLVDSDSGMILSYNGGGPLNLHNAAAGFTQVVRAKRKTLKALGLSGQIEDILISIEDQYHLIRPLAKNEVLFLYLALRRREANLALSRRALKDMEKKVRT